MAEPSLPRRAPRPVPRDPPDRTCGQVRVQRHALRGGLRCARRRRHGGRVDAFRDACAEAGVPPVHAALRWLQHHSSLVDGDGIIVGASRLAHLEENLAALASGDALPQAVVDACDAGWAKIKASGVCPSYERGTSLY